MPSAAATQASTSAGSGGVAGITGTPAATAMRAYITLVDELLAADA